MNIATEHQEQATVIEWWGHAHKQYGAPEFALFAIPNGGARHLATASRLKAEGVRRGVPDLMLAMPVCGAHGLFIEMKRGDGGRTTQDQRDFLLYLSTSGYTIAVASGFDEARVAISTYLRPLISRIVRPSQRPSGAAHVSGY